MSSPEAVTQHRARTCFVIGPIGNRLAPIGSDERDVYEQALRVMAEVIEPACQQVGLQPVRADSLAQAGEITDQIFRRLRDDDVVIADLTGANPNVMYELGLRHTRDKITVQIGEYGRLPFDVNQIRTVQFSPSRMGLVDAREELTAVLAAALEGDFDTVAATRIWSENAEVAAHDAEATTNHFSSPDGNEDDRGIVDVLADAEEQSEALGPAVEAVGAHIIALGELAERSTGEMEASDAQGRGMRGRLQVATRYAAALDSIASELEVDVERYVEALNDVSAGNLALIAELEANPGLLEEAGARSYAMLLRQMAETTRESMASLAGMVEAVRETAKASRVMRKPSQRLSAALDRFAQATGVIDEWDRRLQALGVPTPPPDWTFEEDKEDEPLSPDVDGDESSDGPTAANGAGDGPDSA